MKETNRIFPSHRHLYSSNSNNVKVVKQTHLLPTLYCLILTAATWDIYYYVNFKEMKTKEIKYNGQYLCAYRPQTSLSLFIYFLPSSLLLSMSVSALCIFTPILSLSLTHYASQLLALSPSSLLCYSCSVHVTSVPPIPHSLSRFSSPSHAPTEEWRYFGSFTQWEST